MAVTKKYQTERVAEAATRLQRKGAYLIGRTRRVKKGDEVEIVRILEPARFNPLLPVYKPLGLLSGRERIIKSCPTETIRLKGRLGEKFSKGLWRITAEINGETLTGIFSRKEFIPL